MKSRRVHNQEFRLVIFFEGVLFGEFEINVDMFWAEGRGVLLVGPFRIPLMGNPLWYATWQDESLNLRIRQIGESLHAWTFEPRLLLQWNKLEAKHAQSSSSKRRKLGN